MTKTTSSFLGALAVAGLMAAPALAQDHTEVLGNFTIESGAANAVSGSFSVDPGLPMAGLSVSLDYSNPQDTGTWASDLIFTITGPSGSSHWLGGFPAPGGDNDWDFQGGGSADPGHYTHGPQFDIFTSGGDSTLAGGTWTWELENTWGEANWDNFTVTLHAIPEPAAAGALALGALGLLARRRA